MEVHSHTHTPRQKWTHYIWEFLMLFLAVFCGFLAENIREHKVERHREKDFMKSLLYDLRRDSIFLMDNIVRGPRIVRYADSLVIELRKRPLMGHEKRLYHFACLISEGLGFRYYDRTASQLRNAGGFRLVRNTIVSDAIMDYDVFMREALAYSGSIESWSFVNPALNKSASIFDIDLVFRYYNETRRNIENIDSVPWPPGLRLLTYDDKEIIEYVGLQRYAGITDIVKLDNSQNAFQKNRTLDSMIRKEYHLK